VFFNESVSLKSHRGVPLLWNSRINNISNNYLMPSVEMQNPSLFLSLLIDVSGGFIRISEKGQGEGEFV